jgi:hypothetical protein
MISCSALVTYVVLSWKPGNPTRLPLYHCHGRRFSQLKHLYHKIIVSLSRWRVCINCDTCTIVMVAISATSAPVPLSCKAGPQTYHLYFVILATFINCSTCAITNAMVPGFQLLHIIYYNLLPQKKKRCDTPGPLFLNRIFKPYFYSFLVVKYTKKCITVEHHESTKALMP